MLLEYDSFITDDLYTEWLFELRTRKGIELTREVDFNNNGDKTYVLLAWAKPFRSSDPRIFDHRGVRPVVRCLKTPYDVIRAKRYAGMEC